MMQTLEDTDWKPHRLTQGIVCLGIPYTKAEFELQNRCAREVSKRNCVILGDMIEVHGMSFSYFK